MNFHKFKEILKKGTMEICSVMNGDKYSNNKSINLLKSNSKEELALDGLCYSKDVFTSTVYHFSRNNFFTCAVLSVSQKHY